jgi:hypothetical protein
MKNKMEKALELIDFGMTHEGCDLLREVAVEIPAVNAVIELMDFGDNDTAAAKLREVIAAQG